MVLNESTLEFDVKSQADKLLQLFTRVLKDHDEVEVEPGDWEKMEIAITVTSSDILRKYKTIKVTATITPKDEDGDGSLVNWAIKIDKIPHYHTHENPHISINTGSKTVEFYQISPAQELFKAFMEALKLDDEVEVEAEDWENRTTTINLIETDILETYKTLKVTIVMTPTDSDGSHVKCTIVYGQIPGVIDDPVLSIKTAAYVFTMIDDKLLK